MIKQIIEWFRIAKPNPTAKDIATQIGCHYEEVGEMMQAMGECVLQQKLEYSADWLKSGKAYLGDIDKVALCDALCDQIVTAIGVGYMMGFDMEKALAEVIRSNYSKFDNGQPIFNEHGKIIKGANYTPPNLNNFIGDKEKS